MKIAPIMEQMGKRPDRIDPVLLHTGQHYDEAMSRVFFDDLGIPPPDINLEVGSGSHAEQTAAIMVRFEKVLLQDMPDLVLVVGDVNSTLACSVTASKLNVPVAHVEAGLRSFDRTMPEEINRIVTDSLSSLLFTTCEDANENLRNEGISEENIFFVGNPMIDTLLKHREKVDVAETAGRLGVEPGGYILVTLHRPSNVDSEETLTEIAKALNTLAREAPVIFPAHPRTREKIERFGLDHMFRPLMPGNRVNGGAVWLTEPFGYLEFLGLTAGAKAVITDSGGIQEETTILGVPCLTVRPNTERPVTITEGSNVLVGTDREKIVEEGMKALKGTPGPKRIPKLWDGRASERIVEILIERLS